MKLALYRSCSYTAEGLSWKRGPNGSRSPDAPGTWSGFISVSNAQGERTVHHEVLPADPSPRSTVGAPFAALPRLLGPPRRKGYDHTPVHGAAVEHVHGTGCEPPPVGRAHILVVVMPEVQSAVALRAVVELDDVPGAAGAVCVDVDQAGRHHLPDPVVVGDGRAPQVQGLGPAGGDPAAAQVPATLLGPGRRPGVRVAAADRVGVPGHQRPDGQLIFYAHAISSVQVAAAATTARVASASRRATSPAGRGCRSTDITSTDSGRHTPISRTRRRKPARSNSPSPGTFRCRVQSV